MWCQKTPRGGLQPFAVTVWLSYSLEHSFWFFILPSSGTIFSQPPRLGRRLLSVIQHLSAASSHVEWHSVTTLLNKHLSTHLMTPLPILLRLWSTQRGVQLRVQGSTTNAWWTAEIFTHTGSGARQRAGGLWKEEDASSSLGNLGWTVIGATHSWRHICPTLKA